MSANLTEISADIRLTIDAVMRHAWLGTAIRSTMMSTRRRWPCTNAGPTGMAALPHLCHHTLNSKDPTNNVGVSLPWNPKSSIQDRFRVSSPGSLV